MTLRSTYLHEGLSPRVRGSPHLAVRWCGHQGSIPACAGEPVVVVIRKEPTRVYPRVCGGADSTARPSQHMYGLSPRVRGSRAGRLYTALRSRSIPACAGEPRLTPRQTGRNTVYPRVCGGAHGNGRRKRHA